MGKRKNARRQEAEIERVRNEMQMQMQQQAQVQQLKQQVHAQRLPIEALTAAHNRRLEIKAHYEMQNRKQQHELMKSRREIMREDMILYVPMFFSITFAAWILYEYHMNQSKNFTAMFDGIDNALGGNWKMSGISVVAKLPLFLILIPLRIILAVMKHTVIKILATIQVSFWMLGLFVIFCFAVIGVILGVILLTAYRTGFGSIKTLRRALAPSPKMRRTSNYFGGPLPTFNPPAPMKGSAWGSSDFWGKGDDDVNNYGL